MPQRHFTTQPREKADDYHGSCQIAKLPPVFAAATGSPIPKSLNLDLTFEEALKFGVAVQSGLQAINRYNRSTKVGRQIGLSLSIKFDEQQITVIEKAVK